MGLRNTDLIHSDEDEESEQAAGGGEGEAQGDDGEAPVKKEQGARKSRARTPSHELRTYTEDELATFKRRELLADTELLDGQWLRGASIFA